MRPQRFTISRSALLAGFFVFTACTSDDPAPLAPQVEEGPAGAPPPAAPLPEVEAIVPPASAWLHGEFEYRSSHVGREVRLGLKVGQGVLERTNQGQVTASEPFRVLQDEPQRLVLELLPSDGPPKVRELIFDGEDAMWDAAAPELRYQRIARGAPQAPAAEGSGVDQATGTP